VRTFVLLAQKKIDKKEKEETEKRIVFSFFLTKSRYFSVIALPVDLIQLK